MDTKERITKKNTNKERYLPEYQCNSMEVSHRHKLQAFTIHVKMTYGLTNNFYCTYFHNYNAARSYNNIVNKPSLKTKRE